MSTSIYCRRCQAKLDQKIQDQMDRERVERLERKDEHR